MVRFIIGLLALICLFSTGCRHGRTSCQDHRSLCERIRDRFDDRRDGNRRDPGPTAGGTLRDPVLPPDVIPPRGESIPATPLPTTPNRTNFSEFDSLPEPRRSSDKLPLLGPPLSVPSDPVLVTPKENQPRKLLLPDPLLQKPLEKQSPSNDSGIFDAPILSNSEATPPKSESKSDLPPETISSGIDGFAPVAGQDRVAGGRKPTLDGLDALKSKGYKTVLYLHESKADIGAIRDAVESRGMKFVGLTVTPEALGQSAPMFAEQLKDATSKPLYVFDLDGTRAGSLWYLHFRKVELLAHDVARIRANSLGLKDGTDSDLQKQFWLAIQTELSVK